MNFREAAFWGRDRLFGRRIDSELRDVELLNNRSKASIKRRLDLLGNHLDYVTSKVPYYKTLGNESSLENFPILTKEEIRANGSRMLAEGVNHAKLYVATTSGSTGTPFRVYQNVEKRRRSNAEVIYMGRLAGYNFGSPLWYLKIWTQRTSYGRLGAFTRNVRPIDVSKFSEDDALSLLREVERHKGILSIIGHSSSLETIARAIKDQKQTISKESHIAAIVGQAEPLSQKARSILWKTLGSCPVGRYGLQELGILAQQDVTQDQTYHMNMASFVVEVLRLGDDTPASEGETGRVIVTDLFNKAQPLIRYDTGDLAIVGTVEDQSGFAESLSRLDGRSRERLYDVDDEPLSPLIAYNFWWKFSNILQYQIVQQARGTYTLRLDVTGEFDQESQLVEEFRKQVGKGAQINVEYGDSNYQHASGKRRTIVSEYVPHGA